MTAMEEKSCNVRAEPECKKQALSIAKMHRKKFEVTENGVTTPSDVAYHFMICPNGTVYEGRPGKNTKGRHAWGINDNSIGIMMMGNYQTDRKSQRAPDSFLPASTVNAVGNLIAYVAHESSIDLNSMDTDVSNTKVSGAIPALTMHQVIGNAIQPNFCSKNDGLPCAVGSEKCECGPYVDECPGSLIVTEYFSKFKAVAIQTLKTMH